jgi:hypothetical protein
VILVFLCLIYFILQWSSVPSIVVANGRISFFSILNHIALCICITFCNSAKSFQINQQLTKHSDFQPLLLELQIKWPCPPSNLPYENCDQVSCFYKRWNATFQTSDISFPATQVPKHLTWLHSILQNIQNSNWPKPPCSDNGTSQIVLTLMPLYHTHSPAWRNCRALEGLKLWKSQWVARQVCLLFCQCPLDTICTQLLLFPAKHLLGLLLGIYLLLLSISLSQWSSNLLFYNVLSFYMPKKCFICTDLSSIFGADQSTSAPCFKIPLCTLLFV